MKTKYLSITRRCKRNKCITRKIRNNNPKSVQYAHDEKSILIENESDIEKYFDCYKFPNNIKNLCKKWILLGGGCFLDYSSKYCGTLYFSKTKKSNYYDHIHIFPYSKYRFSWKDKKTGRRGIEYYDRSIDKSIRLFSKLLHS
jgi:hypothetical protein